MFPPSKIRSFLRVLQPWLIGLYFVNHDSMWLGYVFFIIAGFYFADFVDVLKMSSGGVIIKEMKFKRGEAPDAIKKIIAEMEAQGEHEKCKDPHCPNCWGLAENDEPKV